MKNNTYRGFLLMLVVSFIIMYTIMFLNVDSIQHVYLSLTRLYMSLLMVSSMALFMLLFMGSMYTDKRMNILIIFSSIAVFVLSLTFLRTQTFVSDEQYMHAMIPHHSSAILTSKHANLQDPEVKKLAEDIIKAQEREIAQMKQILERLK